MLHEGVRTLGWIFLYRAFTVRFLLSFYPDLRSLDVVHSVRAVSYWLLYKGIATLPPEWAGKYS